MGKLELDVIHPNLYVMDNENVKEIYFAAQKKSKEEGKGRNYHKVLRSINEIVEKYIGTLKVYKSDFEILKEGKVSDNEKGDKVSLKEYLDLCKKKGDLIEFSTPNSKIFNLRYFINATTSTNDDSENFRKNNFYNGILRDVENLDQFKELKGLSIDKEIFRSSIMENLEELHAKLPGSTAYFLLIKGEHPIFEETHVGNISLFFKKEDKSKIESAKSELTKLLKEIGGPCLSYDTPYLIDQMKKLSNDSSEIIDTYGDILLNPQGWKKRLFRLDP